MSVEPRRLIVNADDFGFRPSIDRAILRAAEHGIVTSASVIPTGDSLAAVTDLADAGIGVGVHLTAVAGGAPLLSASEVPSLVDRDGRFPRSWRALVARFVRGAVDPSELEREWSAQIEAVRAHGVEITHLDTHQNVHLWPAVAEVTVRLARRHGIGVVRVPRTARRGPFAAGVRYLSRGLARRARRAGLAVTGASVGLDEAGAMHGRTLERAIDRLARSGAAAVDLICHPGEDDDDVLAALGWRFDWQGETDALCDPATRRVVDDAGFVLSTYRELALGPTDGPSTPARPSNRS